MGLDSQPVGLVAHAATILLRMRGDVVQLADLPRPLEVRYANRHFFEKSRSIQVVVGFAWHSCGPTTTLRLATAESYQRRHGCLPSASSVMTRS